MMEMFTKQEQCCLQQQLLMEDIRQIAIQQSGWGKTCVAEGGIEIPTIYPCLLNTNVLTCKNVFPTLSTSLLAAVTEKPKKPYW